MKSGLLFFLFLLAGCASPERFPARDGYHLRSLESRARQLRGLRISLAQCTSSSRCEQLLKRFSRVRLLAIRQLAAARRESSSRLYSYFEDFRAQLDRPLHRARGLPFPPPP